MHTYIHTHIRSYIHTHIRARTHTYTTHTRVYMHTASLPAEGKQAMLFNAGVCDSHMVVNDDKAASQ